MDSFYKFSWITCFCGMALLGGLWEWLGSAQEGYLLIGSFGATAALVFGLPFSPVSHPKNVVLGHVTGAVIGIAILLYCPAPLWFTGALSVTLTLAASQVLRIFHPPACATSLIAAGGGAHIAALGFWFVLTPVLAGSLVLALTGYATRKILDAQQIE